MRCKVYLVGAGPGDPELLTLKAARLLAGADVVLHDALVSDGVLAMVSHAAAIINVGKRAGHKLLTQDEINALLVSYGRTRSTVVRLKGGSGDQRGAGSGGSGRNFADGSQSGFANSAYNVFPGDGRQRDGLGQRHQHNHAGSLYARGRLCGSFRAAARRRASGRPSVRDRLSRHEFAAASTMVECHGPRE